MAYSIYSLSSQTSFYLSSFIHISVKAIYPISCRLLLIILKVLRCSSCTISSRTDYFDWYCWETHVLWQVSVNAEFYILCHFSQFSVFFLHVFHPFFTVCILTMLDMSMSRDLSHFTIKFLVTTYIFHNFSVLTFFRSHTQSLHVATYLLIFALLFDTDDLSSCQWIAQLFFLEYFLCTLKIFVNISSLFFVVGSAVEVNVSL